MGIAAVPRDRRAERHLLTRRRILDEAWILARARGLGGWSLRDVADAVGMRTPSLYVYFDSKNALYDEMFADGYTALLNRIDGTSTDGEPAEVLRRAAHLSFDFLVEDPARYQLLFLRTIPGFSPSTASYALAQRVIGSLTEVLQGAGIGAPQQVDLWTAVFTGLASQQISNDPGGDRWKRLVDTATELFIAQNAVSTGLPAVR
ncbi:MAG: TetR/AcrR family transcriptional regulator [Nakamurella sp.]